MTSRFKVVDAPTLQPAIDYVTGTGVGPFIDTGKDILGPGGRIMGRLYLSKDSVAEMARELGLVGGHADRSALDDAYHRGLLDGMKEDLGGDLYSVSTTLARWLSHISPDVPADSGEEADGSIAQAAG